MAALPAQQDSPLTACCCTSNGRARRDHTAPLFLSGSGSGSGSGGGGGSEGDSSALPPWSPLTWQPILSAAAWPWAGEIAFKSFSTRYRPSLPPVLSSLTFTIAPGTTCGVVGRTGSGKTSLMLSLFRLLEACGGGIWIDGVDISRVNLYHLRSRLAIIPQEPTLFSGTIRQNLDPFGTHTGPAGEARLLQCLDKAGLGHFATSEGGKGLDTPVAQGGANLSSGQRQLVCMARALLRGAKILGALWQQANCAWCTARRPSLSHTLTHLLSTARRFPSPNNSPG